MSSKLVTILGPTAVGKTKFAIHLANIYNGEIISADSRQVYKGMDIGTGKDLQDYKTGTGTIKYHLIDITDPTEEFNLYKFREHFYKSAETIIKSGRIPFLVGGTGMYLSSVLQNYKLNKADFNSSRYKEFLMCDLDTLRGMLLKLKSAQHNITDIIEKERIAKAVLIAESDTAEEKRVEFDNLIIGIRLDREEIKKRITTRLKKRLEEGMIDEVEKLIKNGVTLGRLKQFGLEYKFIGMYLYNELSYNDMYQKLNSAIHKFAKRQMTWFRKMEKEGIGINWMNPDEHSKAIEMIEEFLYE